MKKRFKMPSAFTVLAIITVLVAVLTWIVPAGKYQMIEDADTGKMITVAGTYEATEQTPQALWEVVQAPMKGFADALDVIVFVLVIGGFLAVVNKTGAINAGMQSLVRKLKGKEIILIPIIMTVCAAGGTIYGMEEETIAFYPLIIPIIIAAGYDALVGVAVVLLGAGVGILASTLNPFAVGIASGFAGISIGEGIVGRLMMLAMVLLFAIIYVMKYAAKVKADPTKSLIYDLKDEHDEAFKGMQSEEVEFTGKRKLILTFFGLSFVVMVLGVIPWAWKFNVTIFEDFNTWLTSIPVLGSVIGGAIPLGDWWFTELSMLFLGASIIVALIDRMDEKVFTETFVNGARDLLGVALVIAVARGITLIMNAGGMTATVLNLGEEGLKGTSGVVFVNLVYLFHIPVSFLITSTSGLATLTMPIMAPLADFVGVSKHLVVTAYQAAIAIAILITPTSGVVMGALAVAKVPYEKWVRFMLPILAGLIVITMIMLTLLTSLGIQ